MRLSNKQLHAALDLHSIAERRYNRKRT
jgi:hypothetical protein